MTVKNHKNDGMISIKEALDIIESHQKLQKTETIVLKDALNRFLAEDILAPEPSPRYTNSAMDGFAVLWSDVNKVQAGKPVILTIAGESEAGVPFIDELHPGQAIIINTGAMIPDTADTVIPVEDVEINKNQVVINRISKKNSHIRFCGEEIKAGDKIFNSGDRLTPAGIGLLASFGIKYVPVTQQPGVAIIVTGTELVSIENNIKPWQIRDSNSLMLMSAVQNSGAKTVFSAQSGDQIEKIRKTIRDGADCAQIILVSGGVSVGPHDLVKQAVEEEGFATLFWRIRQKPGKPLFFAEKQDVLLFGLPGNPVSALNCFVYYIHPLIQKMQGGNFNWDKIVGISTQTIENHGSRSRFIRVKTETVGDSLVKVSPALKQGSHMLSSMSHADGFLLLEPGQLIDEGDKVTVYRFPWLR